MEIPIKNQKLQQAFQHILYEKQKHQKQLPKCDGTYLIDNHNQPSNNQNSWNNITKMLKQTAENTIGYANKSRKSISEDVEEFSLLQRSIKIQIESCINEENRTFPKIYRKT